MTDLELPDFQEQADYAFRTQCAAGRSEEQSVLVTDLDGTLIKTDLLVESFFLYIKTGLFAFLGVFVWVFKGKAELKWRLARACCIDPRTLPYNQAVLNYLRTEKAKGKYLVLASASNFLLVDGVASYLDIFDETISSARKNLSGENKAKALVDRFGKDGFEYIGNSRDDVPVWECSESAVVVSSSYRTARYLAKMVKEKSCYEIVYEAPRSAWVRAVRLHQWLKNILVFVPLFASHKVFELEKASGVIVAFFLFGLCASSIYILNDFLDLQEDRKHRSKKNRPFASGELTVLSGVFMLLLMAGGGSLILYVASNVWLTLVVLVYVFTTTAYSFWLKRVLMADVVVLASLYTIRIVAGGVASGIHISMWLLAFSVFAFSGLALLKRYSEFSSGGKNSGRGYRPEDAQILSSLGTAASIGSVMVLVLYINESGTASLYSRPEFIWLVVPVLVYWFGRIWVLAGRGQVDDDPVLFAAKDRVSILCIFLALLSFFAAV